MIVCDKWLHFDARDEFYVMVFSRDGIYRVNLFVLTAYAVELGLGRFDFVLLVGFFIIQI